MDQLSLNIGLRDDSTFDNFYPGRNEELYHALQVFSLLKGEPFIYVWGMQDSGKTHLLQATCHHAASKGYSAIYLPLSAYQTLNIQALAGMEMLNLICIDDVEAVEGQAAWEEALFHLFNACRARGTYVLISATVAPKGLGLSLNDLKSRLSSGLCYALEGLNDEEKAEALRLRAAKRGLNLDLALAHFLLNHCPRQMSELFARLEILDKASLKAKRRLTIPFAKQVLGL
jgi:DnaA family protein